MRSTSHTRHDGHSTPSRRLLAARLIYVVPIASPSILTASGGQAVFITHVSLRVLLLTVAVFLSDSDNLRP